MPILSVKVDQIGQTGVQPNIIYILTNDTLVQVTTTGYLNGVAAENVGLGPNMMALVTIKLTPNGAAQPPLWLAVSYASGNWSLVAPSGSGSVILPTEANNIAVYINTSGELGEDATTAINGGNIQAGRPGVAGAVKSFSATTGKGALQLKAVANTGDTVTTVSNAAMGQTTTVSIPDPGVATSGFLMTDSAGTQTIRTGDLASELGNIITLGGYIQALANSIYAGSRTLGAAGTLVSYPAPGFKGALILKAIANTGDTETTISNVAMGQASVVSIPDPGTATANFAIAPAALVNGNLVKASGTAGLVADQGFSMKSVAGAAAAGGAAAQSFTDAFCSSGSVVAGNWVTQANAGQVIKIVPGNGSFVVTSTTDIGVGTFSYIITK